MPPVRSPISERGQLVSRAAAAAVVLVMVGASVALTVKTDVHKAAQAISLAARPAPPCAFSPTPRSRPPVEGR